MEGHSPATPAARLPLLTVEEVAAHLHVSRATVYRLVEARRITFLRLHGVLRFSREDLDRWLASQRVASILEYERKKD